MAKEKQTSLVVHEPMARNKSEFLIDFAKFQPSIPNVGVFDEPRRCYPLNNEWAKIFIGFLDLLADPRVWPDAQDETYIGIESLLEFMTGENCMDCTDVENCLETSTTITNINNNITNINNTINNNNVSIDINTTVNNVFPATEQEEIIGGEVPGCDFDAAWSACWTLVNYIDTQNRDFLQEITQSANIANRASLFVSAIPAVGALLPFDEILAYVGTVADDLLSEYNAIVDTALLQNVACELFCIAINNDPCGMKFNNLIDYFASKTPTSLGQLVDTIADLVQFAILGVFSGDDYFYYMSYFQLWVAFAGQEFLGQRGVTQFGLQAAAGKNSPDADWELFCADCTSSWCYFFDFASSQQGWTKLQGSYPYSELGETGFGGGSGLPVEIEIAVNSYVTNATIEMFGIGSNSDGTLQVRNDGILIYDNTLGDNDRTFPINDDVGVLKIYGLRQFGWGVNAVQLSGEGVNPFGADNCP